MPQLWESFSWHCNLVRYQRRMREIVTKDRFFLHPYSKIQTATDIVSEAKALHSFHYPSIHCCLAAAATVVQPLLAQNTSNSLLWTQAPTKDTNT